MTPPRVFLRRPRMGVGEAVVAGFLGLIAALVLGFAAALWSVSHRAGWL